MSKLWCWLFGHKLWAQAAIPGPDGKPILTGTFNPITGEQGVAYRWEKQKFCLRCGMDQE